MDEIELTEDFCIDITDTNINQSQKESSPLEEETLILSDFWY